MTTSLNNAARTPDRGPGPYGNGIVNLTASTALDSSYNDKTVKLNAAAGLTVTLPAATGSGFKVKIVVGTTVTSNGYIIQVANSTDAYQGFSLIVSDDTAAVKGFIASAGSDDTVTLNGTTTGGYVGDVVEIEDIESGKFQVSVTGKATGTEATPFSAAV